MCGESKNKTKRIPNPAIIGFQRIFTNLQFFDTRAAIVSNRNVRPEFMTKNLTICAAGLFLAASAPSQVRSVHPHFQHAPAVSDAMLASLDEIGPTSRKLPFETPTSIACIYHLIPNPAPGCPQSGTRELPTGGSGMIVIVNAYDDPAALHDLNFFSRRFGLPECNESNPCFRQVFATGRRPPLNALWAINAADISEYAHAFAPAAQIVLVEAQSGTNADLDFAIAFANQYVQKNSPTGSAQMILPGAISNRPIN